MSAPTLGEQLRNARIADGYTQRQVAEAVQVGVPYISKIESGHEIPGDDVLYLLASLFDLNGDLLVLYAGRVPQRFLSALAADPVRALDALRNFTEEAPR